jgi:peptidoglycan LD-endopeptidase LytH
MRHALRSLKAFRSALAIRRTQRRHALRAAAVTRGVSRIVRWLPAGLLWAAAACEAEQARDPVEAARTSAIQDSMLQAPVDTLTALAAESLEAPLDKARVTSVTSDTFVITASAAELNALAGALVIPVAGVQWSQLRATYTESRGSRPHDAIDIAAARGTAVVSAADGRLLKLHNSVPGGLMVYAADASDRFILMYGHLDAYAPGLAEGMTLRQGQLLGYVGTTGNAPPETPHLHFAIARGNPSVSWWRGTAVNPYPLLARPAP